MSYRGNREKNLATMLKTILPSLPRVVNITIKRTLVHSHWV